MTNETKKYKKRKNIFKALSFLVTILPIIIYIIIGFTSGEIHAGDKLFLGFSVVVSILLVLINILCKYHLRSPLFVLILGIYIVLKEITPLLIIVSIGVILDEFLFSPLANSNKNKYIINKEIDKRGE